jgi:hypothetical protein
MLIEMPGQVWQMAHIGNGSTDQVNCVAPDMHESIPEHLHQPLRDWLDKTVTSYGGTLARIAAKLQVDSARLKREAQARKLQTRKHRGGGHGSSGDVYVNDAEALVELVQCQPTGLLYLAHQVLSEGDSLFYHEHAARELAAILGNGQSPWRVSDDIYGLVRHMAEPVVQSLTEATSATTPSAAQHLTAAWKHAIALQPDASRAYSEAIKAVEAAIIPVVEPTNLTATLGSVIGRLKSDGPAKWQFVIPTHDPDEGLATLIGMLRFVWQGQTDRHGGILPTRPPSSQSASAVVPLAITLVQWLSTGALSPRQ